MASKHAKHVNTVTGIVFIVHGIKLTIQPVRMESVKKGSEDMIRFFHGNYSTPELTRLKIGLQQIQESVTCGSTDCGDCEYKHICADLVQFLKRVEHLEVEAIHNDSY